ncbi:hydroxymethylglutaryl-CoA reductase, partial [Enterococcus cecorum]|nr:hydroxymethylglutaryl-CoA reductase [Enterococcus cecorum]
IMNGIEALCLALGNDTRALSANIHAFASQDGQYKSLSTWEIVENQLVGKIQLPLMIASVGGATHVLPKAASFHQLLQNSDAKTLSMLLASVGLAQNLAALRALVSEGIQKGHMKMQARSLAMSVGANEHEIASVVEALLQTTMNQENARQILTQIRKSK